MEELNEEQLNNLFKILNIEQIPNDRNYWLIRTESGKYYSDFLKNNYVSIGWDEFSNIDNFKNLSEETLKEKISSTYANEKRPGYIYNQIRRFMFDIEIGDMILIPSENSTEIAFGIVTEKFFIREENDNNTLEPDYSLCKFKKCIKVDWKTKFYKDKLDPNLKMSLFSHITISDMNEYKEYINRLLYSNYILNDEIHVTFNVTSTENINVSDLFEFLNLISNKSIKIFNDVTGYNLSNESVTIKLNVQSPGPIEFIGYAVGGILIVSAINSIIFGSKFDLELSKIIKLKNENKGLLYYILKFIEEKNRKNENIMKLENEFKISKNKLKIKPSEKLGLSPDYKTIKSDSKKESDFKQVSIYDDENIT